MKKRVILLSILAAFLMISVPMIPAAEFNIASKENKEQIKDQINQLFKEIQNNNHLLTNEKKLVSSLIDSSDVDSNLASIKEKIQNLETQLNLQNIQDRGSFFWNLIVGLIKIILNVLISIISLLGNLGTSFLSVLINISVGLAKTVLKVIYKVLLKVVDIAGSGILTLINIVFDTLMNILYFIRDTIANILEPSSI
ncbi:MAG: hypothetical protein V5A68_07010 [Candidatus Thermoplasmatota archaeon]